MSAVQSCPPAHTSAPDNGAFVFYTASMKVRREYIILLLLLGGGLLLRLWQLNYGLPLLLLEDERFFVGPALVDDVISENRTLHYGHDGLSFIEKLWWYLSSVLPWQVGTVLLLVVLVTAAACSWQVGAGVPEDSLWNVGINEVAGPVYRKLNKQIKLLVEITPASGGLGGLVRQNDAGALSAIFLGANRGASVRVYAWPAR